MANQAQLPTENVPRGTILTLLIVPAGIGAWLLIWSLGFIASIVPFLIAMGAMFLYRFGAGRMSVAGAIRVMVITLGTLLIALVAGFAADVAFGVAAEFGVSPFDVLTLPEFWPITFQYMFSDGLLNTLAALAFGALGCFSVLRSAFAEAKKADAALPSPFAASSPTVPATDPDRPTTAAPEILSAPPADPPPSASR